MLARLAAGLAPSLALLPRHASTAALASLRLSPVAAAASLPRVAAAASLPAAWHASSSPGAHSSSSGLLLPHHASAAALARSFSSHSASGAPPSVLETIEAVLADTATAAAAEAAHGTTSSSSAAKVVETRPNAPGDFAYCLRIVQALATPGTQWPEAAKRRFAAVLEATGGVGPLSAFVVADCGVFHDGTPPDMRGRPARGIVQSMRVGVAGEEYLLFGVHQLDANGHPTGNCLSSPTTLETLSTRYHVKSWDKSVKVVWRFTPGAPPEPVESFTTWRKHAAELKRPDGTMVPLIPAHMRHHMSEQWWQAKVRKAAGSELVSLETLGVTNPVTEARRISQSGALGAADHAPPTASPARTRHRRR